MDTLAERIWYLQQLRRHFIADRNYYYVRNCTRLIRAARAQETRA
jgi:hypothetical protein